MKGSDFIFDGFGLLYYKCHEINVKRRDSYLDSPEWIKKKKATINPKNKDDKYFQYAATVALNFDEIKKDLQRVSNIEPFISKYNYDGIKYLSKIDDWKTFEKNNLAIVCNVLCTKEMEICPAYISKYNSNCERNLPF